MNETISNPPPPTAAEIAAVMQTVRAEIAKAIIGQSRVIEEVLIALLAGGHVLIEGVPGIGKTLLVRALARTFGGSHARIQFTPDLMPSDVAGHAIYDLKTERFVVRKGPVFTHVLLADEINRAPAKTQSALLEVMQEQQVTIEGQAFTVPRPFLTLATQNPLEQEGTYPLPEAQLDRFLLKVMMDYPSADEEHRMLTQVTQNQIGDTLDVSRLGTCLTPDGVLRLQHGVSAVQVDSAVTDYAVRLVRATRDWPGIRVGAGPRGGIALLRAGKAHAALAGRDYLTPDDVKHMALPALRHRIGLAPEFELEGETVDELLRRLIEQVAAPRQ
ncbi:MAG: AAA family ATPase [Thiotrichales bacterium]